MWPFTSSSASASPSTLPRDSPSSSTVARSASPRVLTNSEAANPALNALNPEGLKPCCACPETKKARDDCFLRFGSNVDEAGSSAKECEKIVEAHRSCMRSLGFNV